MRHVAAVVVCALALTACHGPRPDAPLPTTSLEHHGYAWQVAALADWAEQEAAPDLAVWWFAGQVDPSPSGPKVSTFPASTEGKVAGAVVRLRTPIVEWLATATDRQLRDDLALPLAAFAGNDRPGGGRLQLDFDCPTGKLHHYERLLAQVRAALPEAELSITALPDWLRADGFPALLDHVDFHVLQVHGLTQPAHESDNAPLFDTRHALDYLAEAAALNAPFYVALPTYGHRQWFRPDGTFVGISAEVPVELSSAAHLVREERAKPAEVAVFLRALDTQRPSHLRGVFWFRLPAEGDSLNWTMDTFRRVLAGEVPVESLHADARGAGDGLVEIHLRNGVERDYRGRAEVRITLAPGLRVWGEGLRGFTFAQQGAEVIFTGDAPAPGESANIGWLRAQTPATLDGAALNPQARSLQ